ncbi:unnamed protein product [Hymenolepis diminuta]|uniref:Uncharacterized protein n=1 Tax=Hymenolepis diminuta TaxID=6216 RepID=A0A564YR56_HYMDI|nr:unnamed protein product [Hymenolepis diminuta]
MRNLLTTRKGNLSCHKGKEQWKGFLIFYSLGTRRRLILMFKFGCAIAKFSVLSRQLITSESKADPKEIFGTHVTYLRRGISKLRRSNVIIGQTVILDTSEDLGTIHD